MLYLPRLVFFKKGPENRQEFVSERLGMSDYAKTDIWVHAVSVGEVLACLPFLKKMKKEFPSKKIVLSTTTYTGQKLARERFPEADRVMYMPVDNIFSVKRVVNSLQPELFITAETEIWPSLFHSLKETGSRIVILNGRISNASYKGYRRIRFIMKKVLANVDYLYMQTKDDADKIIDIGAERHKVGVMGNFKFDIEIDIKGSQDWHKNITGDILLAASTHEGEEEVLLDAYELIELRTQNLELRAQTKDNKPQGFDLTLIIAPRHPERFDEVAGMLDKRSLPYIRRSKIGHIQNSGKLPGIILLDSIGELSALFSTATIAFIGGSLVPKGGHNVMEPAYWSKPAIFGPHMDNFPIAADFLKSSAALEVKDSDEIAETVLELLNDREKALSMGRNAKLIVEDNTGAVKKAVELVRGFIGTP